eukprot:753404-Hanusia_phi.AAC.7
MDTTPTPEITQHRGHIPLLCPGESTLQTLPHPEAARQRVPCRNWVCASMHFQAEGEKEDHEEDRKAGFHR